MRGLSACLLVVLLAFPSTAFADKIDRRSRQLQSARDYKVRLSAALYLGKSRDNRAIIALSRAVVSDRDSTVRRVSALSLAKIVTSRTRDRVRKRAIKALRRASKRDRNRGVRTSASRALRSITAGPAPRTTSRRRSGTVFLNIAKAKDRSRRAGSARTVLGRTVRSTIRRKAPNFVQSSGTLPSQRELVERGMSGYYVGSSISKLAIRKSSGGAEVSCSVVVRVSPWSGRDGVEKLVANRAASASGSGRVVGGGSKSAIEESKRQCVDAVAEQVTSKQVVPFLRRTSASARLD